MRVFIERSKTDVYRDGAWVLVAETATPTCPVALCKRYFDSAHILPCSQEYIFRSLSSLMPSENTYKLRGSSPLSYTKAREIVLSAFKSIGLNKKSFGLHSFRAGGASAAANANINDRFLKDVVAGSLIKVKMGMLKTMSNPSFQFLNL